jgi:hypothetical protein
MGSELSAHFLSNRFNLIIGGLRQKCPPRNKLGYVVAGTSGEYHMGPCNPTKHLRATVQDTVTFGTWVKKASAEELDRLFPNTKGS